MHGRNLDGINSIIYTAGFPCQPYLSNYLLPSHAFQNQTVLFVPATRYSRLRQGSRLMKEPQALPFWSCLEAIGRPALTFSCNIIMFIILIYFHIMPCRSKPLLAVLENVYGVLAVKTKAGFRVWSSHIRQRSWSPGTYIGYLVVSK